MERFIGGVFIDKILRFAQDDNLKGVQYPLGAYLSQGGAEPRPCAIEVISLSTAGKLFRNRCWPP